MRTQQIHAIILTLNEEMHIARCIESIRPHCTTITVVDSGSTDATRRIARELGAEVLENKWVNHATQVNFVIDRFAGRGGWLLRIDADEVIDGDSEANALDIVSGAPQEVHGILVQRRIHFLGRRIRHGAIEPSWQLRLWRNGEGRSEQRWMDEHVVVTGTIAKSGLVISDKNLNSVSWWTAKHNSYATRAAIDFILERYHLCPAPADSGRSLGAQAKMRRFVKHVVYGNLPAGFRPFLYFGYRYFLRLGFLDGVSGFYYHVLQALWYRLLVDAKIHEIGKLRQEQSLSWPQAIEKATGFKL